MLDTCSLHSLSSKQEEGVHSSFDQMMHQFLEHQVAPTEEMIEEACVWHEPWMSIEQLLLNWKQLLAVNLLCYLTQGHQANLVSKVRLFERHPWNQSSYYFRALVAVNHALAKMPIPEVGLHALESGAILIDLQEYCPWLSLPYIPHHFELGVFLCLLSLLTGRQDLQDTLLKLAHWQLNTLDATGLPLKGLFVREKDSRIEEHLCLGYLLFRGVACLSPDPIFATVSQAMFKKLAEQLAQKAEVIHPLWILIEKWLDKYEMRSKAASSLSLAESITDPSTALVGYRSPSQHAICTLHGAQTGLGSVRQGDVEIVSYGPQYLPLGDCQGFGIEGNALSDQGMRRSLIEWRRQSFVLKGCTRLVDYPSASSFESGQFRGIWLEVTQEFKRPHFYLKTSFLGLNGWDDIAFSFFVKASRCRTQTQQLSPRTLERYEGVAQTLFLEGKEVTLELNLLSAKGTMQVIPLAGGNNFWDADFLIAYVLSSDQRDYQWHLGPI